MGAAVKFKSASTPRQPGERARFKVVAGPEQGAIYVVTGPKATIGRGEENDLVLMDLRASRRHAVIEATPQGWALKDLGSANGVIHNNAKEVRAATLRPNDLITFGETALQYLASDLAQTALLTAPAPTLGQLAADQEAMSARRAAVRAIGRAGPAAPGGRAAGSAAALPSLGGKAKAVPLVILAAVGGAALLMMPDGPRSGGDRPQGAPAAAPVSVTRDLASYLPPGEDVAELTRSAEAFFKGGFREYRQGNYLRARQSFETVLQIDPGHRLASLYLDNCKQRIEDTVKRYLDHGRRSMDMGKLRAARGSFEAVTRLLIRDQSGPDFVQAREQLDKVNQLIRKEPG